jgi:histidyl-tRNA synthetase
MIVGEDEMKQEKVSLKDMKTGEQELLSIHQLITKLKGKN